MSRGIERRDIFLDDRYREHFLDLLGEMSERYAVEVHAYVQMDNHYHLLLRTPGANASAAMQWLNVSYSAWFNAKRGRVGHVFQGRFRSTLIDGDGSWLLAASAYLHLNPVRTACRGWDKATDAAEAAGLVEPDRESVKLRLAALRNYRWSSYRRYGGYGRGPEWLVTKNLLARSGGKAGYRHFIQRYLTRGLDPDQFKSLSDRVAIGNASFTEKVRGWVEQVSPEQPQRAFLRVRVPFERIVEVVEGCKQEPWEAFRSRRGDWGGPLVLYLARKRSGLTLREIGEEAGGMEYKTVGKAIERIEARLEKDRTLQRVVARCLRELSTVET